MLFSSAAFACECGHTDAPEHPDDGPCTTCECSKFIWARQDESKPAVSRSYPLRVKLEEREGERDEEEARE